MLRLHGASDVRRHHVRHSLQRSEPGVRLASAMNTTSRACKQQAAPGGSINSQLVEPLRQAYICQNSHISQCGRLHTTTAAPCHGQLVLERQRSVGCHRGPDQSQRGGALVRIPQCILDRLPCCMMEIVAANLPIPATANQTRNAT